MIIYLYIKQHIKTGLKYFGLTTKKNPFKYKGSGLYWKNHIKKYGKDQIKTLEIWGFDDQKLCTEFALKFSQENNIVESKEWANLIEECGNGQNSGPRRKFLSEEHKQKIQQSKLGKSKPWLIEYNRNRIYSHSEETRKKLSNALIGKKRGPYSKEHKQKISIKILGKTHSNETKIKMSGPRGKQQKIRDRLECPHCHKIMDSVNAKRYHFDNCKYITID